MLGRARRKILGHEGPVASHAEKVILIGHYLIYAWPSGNGPRHDDA